MKLASLKSGRDGKLLVVSRDLTRATSAFNIAETLQKALDNWEEAAPRLAGLAEQLEHGSVPSFRFHEHDAASPLPRAYQWIDGSAYVNHVELVRKARGAEMPPSFWSDPLMYQGGSDSLLARISHSVRPDRAVWWLGAACGFSAREGGRFWMAMRHGDACRHWRGGWGR
jgi:fumarylacetoacetate (FAA) hydrolase